MQSVGESQCPVKAHDVEDRGCGVEETGEAVMESCRSRILEPPTARQLPDTKFCCPLEEACLGAVAEPVGTRGLIARDRYDGMSLNGISENTNVTCSIEKIRVGSLATASGVVKHCNCLVGLVVYDVRRCKRRI